MKIAVLITIIIVILIISTILLYQDIAPWIGLCSMLDSEHCTKYENRCTNILGTKNNGTVDLTETPFYFKRCINGHQEAGYILE